MSSCRARSTSGCYCSAGGNAHFPRVTQKVKPNIQIGLQLDRRLPELRQFQSVDLQILREREGMGFFQQSKPQMVVRHLGKEDVVQKADRDRRLEPQVILAFMQLSLVELAAVVQDALFVVAIGQHLHFDIELPAGLIACIDVQDGQLVVERLLGLKGLSNSSSKM